MVRTSLSLIILAMIQNPTKKKGMEGSACYQVSMAGGFSFKSPDIVDILSFANATPSKGVRHYEWKCYKRRG